MVSSLKGKQGNNTRKVENVVDDDEDSNDEFSQGEIRKLCKK